MFAKTCDADMAVPGRLVGADPSPQFIVKDVIEPSGSDAEKPMVTVDPVWAGFGERLLIVTVGGRSFTVSEEVADPEPPLFAAVTVIVKACDATLPVEE